MVSQPTDQCSPRHHYRPLAFIKTERGGKKNGEKTLRLDNFVVPSLTIFSIKLPFFGRMCDQSHPSPQQPMFARSPLPPLAFMKTEQGGKKNREKTLRLDNFAVPSLTVFSIKLPFLVEIVNNDIAAHIPIFAPYPLLPS